MKILLVSLFLLFAVLSLTSAEESGDSLTSAKKSDESWLPVIAGFVGGAVALTGAPVLLAAVGFTSTGIAAGTIASSMMAASGPVISGSAVAVLQSCGQAGLGFVSKAVVGFAGAQVGKALLSSYDE